MPSRGPQSGAKIILFHGPNIVSILRDNTPTIVWPNRWDLPGGGIEAGETPIEGLLREVREELGLRLRLTPFVWQKTYPKPDGSASYFYAAEITQAQIDRIRFGNEGQRWDLMPARTFVTRPDAVPHFQTRVAACFDDIGWPDKTS